MRDEILRHQVLASTLDPPADAREALRARVTRHTESFIARLPKDRAYEVPQPEQVDFSHEEIGEDPGDVADMLARIASAVECGGLNAASGHHFGYIPGGGIYAAALGDFLAAVSNRYAGVWFAAPGAVNLEKRLCRWMADLIGFPASAGGYLASGGSIASLTAIVAARQARGCAVRDADRIVVYLTTQTHHCVDKALTIAGMGECIVRRIDMDDRFRMLTGHLQQQIERDLAEGLQPWLVVGSAGTTDTGAIDPLDAIADIVQHYGLWYHVDAAYGGFFILSNEIRARMIGIERADSVVLDPHKALFLPYGIGALIVRNVATLVGAFQFDANYMLDATADPGNYSPADVSPELSRHFRGLRMWLPLKIHGVAAFRAALEEKLLLARYAWRRLNEWEGFETGPEPQLSVVAFRYLPAVGDPDAFNRALHKALLADGRIFLSSTLLDGRFVLRLAVVSVRTHLEELERALEIIRETVSGLEQG